MRLEALPTSLKLLTEDQLEQRKNYLATEIMRIQKAPEGMPDSITNEKQIVDLQEELELVCDQLERLE